MWIRVKGENEVSNEKLLMGSENLKESVEVWTQIKEFMINFGLSLALIPAV